MGKDSLHRTDKSTDIEGQLRGKKKKKKKMEAAKDGYGEPEGAEEGRVRGGDDFTVYQLYSPFHYLHQLMKALLRFLCFLFPFPRRQKTPTSQEEEEEEEEEYRDRTWRRRPWGPRRKPGRPPIGTGEGGQTN